MRGFRVPLSTLMMVVLAAAAGAALVVRVRVHVGSVTVSGLRTDAPLLLLLAIGLTSVALGSWKSHTIVQILIQGTLTSLGFLTLIWISEARMERTSRYWFQAMFAASVVVPLVIRNRVKDVLPRGPRREWWKKNCEAVFFSFIGFLLVLVGGLLQLFVSSIVFPYLQR